MAIGFTIFNVCIENTIGKYLSLSVPSGFSLLQGHWIPDPPVSFSYVISVCSDLGILAAWSGKPEESHNPSECSKLYGNGKPLVAILLESLTASAMVGGALGSFLAAAVAALNH